MNTSIMASWARGVSDLRWVAGWAWFMVRVAMLAAAGCGGSPYATDLPPIVGAFQLGATSSCFPTYANKTITVASSGRQTTLDAVADLSPTMCEGCGKASHGYTSYDGKPPNSTCIYPTEGDGAEYCCTDALCVPRVPSQCPITIGNMALGSVPPYEWTCAVGAVPQAGWGCVPNPLDTTTFCCNTQP